MLGAYAQLPTDISGYVPIIIVVIFVLILFFLLKGLSGGSRYGGGGSRSWKVYSFFIGIALIASSSIISNFLNMPTMTTQILGIGAILVVVAIIGALMGLGK